jgi:cobyrinic acid a,c-diamide synthase
VVPVTTQPRLVIAATRSGDGKTTVATGLMAALRAGGMRVSAHKVGPDYIDPSYHAAATGSPGRNLDPFLVGEDLIAPLFRHGASGADISVIEGVMGLFDGATGRGDFASTAHVARLLAAPIVLVVGAAGTARSIAATVHGFATFDPRVQVAGVVLNQVSTPRHEEILREALAPSGIPVLGALPAQATLHTPSRHLGLVPAAERADQLSGWLLPLRELIGRHLDLDRLLAVARAAPPLTAPAWSPPAPSAQAPSSPAAVESRPAGPPVRIAVAAGRAFTFGYAEHHELLAGAGAEILTFDPMAAERLPAGSDALIVGGGFPEVYAAELAANAGLRGEVRERVAAGMPVIAECAGLLWLGGELDGREQCGVLPAAAQMTGKLTLGYREAVALRSSPLAPAGTAIRAHEFHRTVSEPAAGASPAWRLADGSQQGWASRHLLASYLHVHWASLPETAPRLVAAARAAREARAAAQPGAPQQAGAGAQRSAAGKAGT